MISVSGYDTKERTKLLPPLREGLRKVHTDWAKPFCFRSLWPHGDALTLRATSKDAFLGTDKPIDLPNRSVKRNIYI
jgi:hypothetical protein